MALVYLVKGFYHCELQLCFIIIVKVSERLEEKKKAKAGGSSKAPAATSDLPKSDAVLNCPACMSAVCLDCQRSVSQSLMVHGIAKPQSLMPTNLVTAPIEVT